MSDELEKTNEKSKNKNIKTLCILCYISILWVVSLSIEKDNDDIKFHANQGIILTIFSLIFYFTLKLISLILFMIAHMFVIITSLLWLIFVSAFFTYMIIGIYNAYKGLQKPLPLIGKIFTILK